LVESRKYPRQSIRMNVSFRSPGGTLVQATCRDLSLGGMFVETDQPAAFGASVEVVVQFPGLKGDTTIGSTVRWTSNEGMGVQFGVMGARETHALTELMRA